MNRRNFFTKLIAAVGSVSFLSSFKSEEQKPVSNFTTRSLPDRNCHSYYNVVKPYRSRPERYVQYEQMDRNPVYSKLLDNLAKNIHYSGLKISSPDPQIEKELRWLFHEVVEIDFPVSQNFYWIRNAAKYGNNFVYVLSTKGKGVIKCKPILGYVEIKDTDSGRQYKVDDQLLNSYEVLNLGAPVLDLGMLPYGMSLLERIKAMPKGEVYFDDQAVAEFKQSMIHSYNKLAVIHLHALGYKEVKNFKITLNEKQSR